MNSEKFNKLPTAKKARVVAWDVTQQIKADKNMKVGHSGYALPISVFDKPEKLEEGHSHCTVCAKGSMMLSYLRMSKDNSIFEGNANNYKSTYNWKQGSGVSKADTIKYFGKAWDVIECIYESQSEEESGRLISQVFNESVIIGSEVTEDQIMNFRKYCYNMDGKLDDNVVTQLMRNYLLNGDIDLTNHPHHDEEIYYDEASATVTVCDVHETLNFNEI